MSDSILIPLQVFGWGFFISIFIAFMIKALLKTIRFVSRDSK